MSKVMERDSKELHAALTKTGETVNLTLSKETVELVLKLVDARAHGKRVLVVEEDEEVTPAQAAPLLGMSRPQVRKLIDQGLLDARQVGTHHRIKVESIRRFKDIERQRSRVALANLAALQNDLGLTE